MSRSSEEVLLIVNNVKHKKSDGSLYMMSQRMAWMQESKDSFSISHAYADIKVQKISPDTKDKIQLQVTMHNGSANTFQFVNPMGRDAQKQDRESIKELLQQVLPKFRRKVNSELEEKNRILQEDPELFQLYKDLVVSGIVSAEEFWTNRANSKQNKNNSQQEIGVSAAFLADIKPQTDGCNGLKYNLTTDIIKSIFKTYPAVKRKHAEHVPGQLSESEFWTRFFQSHYFHRDRINFGSKDLFAECAKTDDQEILKEMEKSPEDSLMDLTTMSDQTLSEGYGSSSIDPKASTNPANASLLRRFNQHSTMVLKACSSHSSEASSSASNSQTNGSGPIGNNNKSNKPSSSMASSAHTEGEPPPAKKVKIREKLEYSDLEGSKNQNVGPVLKLTKSDRYLHGPTTVTAIQYNTGEDILQACTAVSHEVRAWQPRLTQVLSSSSAVSILGELSPGGLLMQRYSQQQLNQMIPQDVQQDLRNLYNALCELLRHFWSCFPTSTPLLEEKLHRMKANLERFQTAKLNPLKDKLQSRHYNLALTNHMEEMLSAAYNKFTTWQTRRMNRK